MERGDGLPQCGLAGPLRIAGVPGAELMDCGVAGKYVCRQVGVAHGEQEDITAGGLGDARGTM
jgi:hypothetical protein